MFPSIDGCIIVIISFHPYTCSCHDCISDDSCGWCDNTCVHTSATCSTNLTTTPCGCLSPMITSISPGSGPTEGGTTVTITGTDLGTSFSDIINITVGSLSCAPIKDNYLVGSRVTCDISSSNQTQPGSVDVVINVCNNKEAIGQFRFGQPRVYSVSPSYGPAAGGTVVRIRGEDLNIGNTERTTVSLVANGNTGRRRRRQTMGTPFCNIT